MSYGPASGAHDTYTVHRISKQLRISRRQPLPQSCNPWDLCINILDKTGYGQNMDTTIKFMSKGFKPPTVTSSYELYECSDFEISVVGRISRRIAFWRQIGATPFILKTIHEGYHIPLTKTPPAHQMRNNASSRNKPEFVQTAIDELLVMGAIMEVDKPPYIVNPLTVSNKNDKFRLVLDLRHVNKFVHKQPCKIEGAETLQKFLPGADHLYGFDLKAGYHHIDIHPEQHQLLGFSYPDHWDKDRFFVFRVLPFGLSSAGFIFTKMLRVLIKYWRGQSIKILAFFDDGLGTASSYQEGVVHSIRVKQDLLAAGYVPNKVKSVWIPQRILVWLGFIYDLVVGTVMATTDKIEKTIATIQEVLSVPAVPVVQLASVTGLITSLYPAYGDVVFLKSKSTQMIIAADEDWARMVNITRKSRVELQFWVKYLPDNNGMTIQAPIANGVVTYSDASATGCASVFTPHPDRQKLVIHRPFSEDEQKTSSTYRELLCVYHGLDQTKHILKGQSIRWFTDSSNIVSIIRKGSMVPDLLQLAILIFDITRKYNIQLAMTWVRREDNTEADAMSRVINYDDWGVHPNWFKHICGKLGQADFDRFADQNNAKTKLYNSRFFTSDTAGIEAFTQDWSGYLNWLVPPIHLVGCTLQYLEMLKCTGILVVPV